MAPLISESEMEALLMFLYELQSRMSPFTGATNGNVGKIKIKTKNQMRTGNYNKYFPKKFNINPLSLYQRRRQLDQVLERQFNVNYVTPTFKEQSTQTDPDYFAQIAKEMEATCAKLKERVRYLKAQLRSMGDNYETEDTDEPVEVKVEDDNIQLPLTPNSLESDYDDSTLKSTGAVRGSPTVNYESNRQRYILSESILNKINWKSYTSATRKLLTLVFPRRILGTHSLTGKPSPAFPGRPAKKQLDPVKVDYIVDMVKKKCIVSESLVRNIITTKCADEGKILRNLLKHNKENRTAMGRYSV